jgi:NAD(P)-dependent dehydrogenase (short-subunit alcohol dehydrogenase family)
MTSATATQSRGLNETVEQDLSPSMSRSQPTFMRRTHFLSAALAPKMRAQVSGSIVNISTMAARDGGRTAI